MRSRLASISLLVALVGAGATAKAGAQTMSESGATVTIAAPTEAQYDAAGASSNSSTVVLTTTCTGTNNDPCTLRMAYTGLSTLTLQWQISAKTQGSGDQCDVGAGFGSAPTAFFDMPAVSTVVFTSTKNDSCTITFVFRVKTLGYTTHQAPGPITQNVRFSWSRP